jgi:hypothetical protein
MKSLDAYAEFPVRTVLVSNLFSLASYALGIGIMLKAGLVFAPFYLAYILILEVRLLKTSCTYCYYCGKRCGFGKGKISAFFFGFGEPKEFNSKTLSWKHMLPNMLVVLIPLGTAIFYLLTDFNLIVLLAALFLAGLSTAGNGYVRGKLTCKHCRQRELGCPAEQLFNKK